MTESVSTPPDRPEIVRNLTPEELADWMPHVGTLARDVRAVWVDLLRTPDWEPIPAGVDKLCRQPKCQQMGVAELRRVGQRDRVTWWAYCQAHVRGQWVTGDGAPQLLTRRLVTTGAGNGDDTLA
jgi:hypothetical protein